MDILNQIAQSLQQGKNEEVFELTQQAITEKVPLKNILDKGLIAGMNVVGEQFRKHEIFLPEVLMAARAMYAGMDQLKPLLIKEGIPGLGKIVIGTIQGDLHDIGKNLVGIMLQGAGFEVVDLGNDVPFEKFVAVAEAEGAKVIGMSALLTTTMVGMGEVISILKKRGLTDRIKTIVGGAPTSETFAREIGADVYAYDAANAVQQVKQLMGV